MGAKQDWKASHPFAVGQLVYAVCDLQGNAGQVMAAGSAVTVYARGCDECGNWVCFKTYPGSAFPVLDFCGAPLPKMLAVVADDEELAA